MKKVLLTGSTGFIGSKLYRELTQNNYSVVCPVRNNYFIDNSDYILVDDFTGDLDFTHLLPEIDVVIHLAAKAHINQNSLTSIDRNNMKICNVEATLSLAKQAAACGVNRFIFLSSIGVNGNQSITPFLYDDPECPIDFYSNTKLTAEIGLKKIVKDSNMDFVIIRPPLVYGDNAPGNFNKLINLSKYNYGIPLGAIHNKRSFVSVYNLVDLIVCCIDNPNASNQTFLVSDDEDLSTTELIQKIIKISGRSPFLLPVPLSLLKFIAFLFNKKSMVDKLSSSLMVDIEHTKCTLNWKPPYSIDEGIYNCLKKID